MYGSYYNNRPIFMMHPNKDIRDKCDVLVFPDGSVRYLIAKDEEKTNDKQKGIKNRKHKKKSKKAKRKMNNGRQRKRKRRKK